jgi:hypothetical protein
MAKRYAKTATMSDTQNNMDLKDKSVLCIDNGLFVSLAERLSKDFGKVGYYYDWQSGFPDGRELIIGEGIEGVERVKYLWDVINDYDLIVFPDCWHSDMQEYLRRLGKRVWGTGNGAELELRRWKTHELLPSIGLDQNKAVLLNGISALREYLESHDEQFVKISMYRGIGETWHSPNIEMAEGMLREISDKCGPLADVIDFIVEESVPDAVEIGYDGYCIDGKFPDKAVVGIERKDKSYFGRLCAYDALPENVRKVNDALAGVISQYQYRQFFSTEIREKGSKAYLIDLTCRHPSPAGEVEMMMFENLAEILWEGADGRLVNPVTKFKYGAQIIIKSEWYSAGHYQPITFPEEIRPFVKIYNHCRIGGMDYAVPQLADMAQIGSVVALGNTPEETVKKCKEMAEQVKGFDIETEADSLDEAVSELEESL